MKRQAPGAGAKTRAGDVPDGNARGSAGKRFGIPVAFFFLILLAAGGFFLWKFLHDAAEYEKGERIYGEVREEADVPEPEASAEPDDGPVGEALLDIDFDALLAMNPDTIGWLVFENADVSLPVVREREDNFGFYLHHAFTGEDSKSGCLFTDAESDPDFLSYNTFIYGHNMANGTMFGKLKSLNTDRSLLTKPYFEIYTKGWEHVTYRVMAMYLTGVESEQFVIPHLPQEYDAYVENALALGSLDATHPFADGTGYDEVAEAISGRKPVVTLYVCTPAGKDKRLYVQGIEVGRERVPGHEAPADAGGTGTGTRGSLTELLERKAQH